MAILESTFWLAAPDPALLDMVVMGQLANRGYSVYGTAKAAMIQLTRLNAADLAPRIRVNAIAPGAIATDALAGVLKNEELERLIVQGTPMRRLGRVADIALGAVYLARRPLATSPARYLRSTAALPSRIYR